MNEPKHLKKTEVTFGDVVEDGMKEDASVILRFDDRILDLERKITHLEYNNDDLQVVVKGLSIVLVLLVILIAVLARKRADDE